MLPSVTPPPPLLLVLLNMWPLRGPELLLLNRWTVVYLNKLVLEPTEVSVNKQLARCTSPRNTSEHADDGRCHRYKIKACSSSSAPCMNKQKGVEMTLLDIDADFT